MHEVQDRSTKLAQNGFQTSGVILQYRFLSAVEKHNGRKRSSRRGKHHPNADHAHGGTWGWHKVLAQGCAVASAFLPLL